MIVTVNVSELFVHALACVGVLALVVIGAALATWAQSKLENYEAQCNRRYDPNKWL